MICVVLGIVSIFCFWFALSGTNTPSSPANRGKAASPQSESGGVTSASAAGLASTGGDAHINSASSSATNSPRVTSAGRGARTNSASSSTTNSLRVRTDNLSCRMQCQTGNSTCQGSCYQQYSVTNQTLLWTECMQSCGSNLNSCSTACVSGAAFSPTSVHPPAPSPAPVPPPSPTPKSTPTPLLSARPS